MGLDFQIVMAPDHALLVAQPSQVWRCEFAGARPGQKLTQAPGGHLGPERRRGSSETQGRPGGGPLQQFKVFLTEVVR